MLYYSVAFFALSNTSCGNLILWIGSFSVASLTVIRLPKVCSWSRFGRKHVLFFRVIEKFFPPRHLNAKLLRLILNILTVFRTDRDHQHFSFHLRNTICDLFVYCQSYFLLLSKHFVGYLHHREAGSREILMPSCLALMDLERVVDLNTWKMKKINTIVKEKVGYIDASFWKISTPISMLYVNLWLPYPTPLSRTIFPHTICWSCTHFYLFLGKLLASSIC